MIFIDSEEDLGFGLGGRESTTLRYRLGSVSADADDRIDEYYESFVDGAPENDSEHASQDLEVSSLADTPSES